MRPAMEQEDTATAHERAVTEQGILRRLSEWLDSVEVTRRLKRGASRVPGLSSMIKFSGRRRLRRFERRGDAWQRSRSRWRAGSPDAGLTWGIELSGDPLVDVADGYGAFGRGRTILEIGPGYGRLLFACLARGVEFDRYVALDISENNVRGLRDRISDERVTILEGDAETASFESPYDTVLSFLTFKHFYPSFESVLRNLEPQLQPGALVLFDLIEGTREYFEWDQVTFVREYTREDVKEILERSSLGLVAFDTVEHAPDRVRMVVVAKKPS
jgi:SAM-dependent methyltransferase